MKWIGKGTLKISNKLTLKYGDDIPKKGISSERLKVLKEQGKIGDIIENIAEHPEIRALKEVIRRRDEKIKEQTAQIKDLTAQIKELAAPPKDPDDPGDEE